MSGQRFDTFLNQTIAVCPGASCDGSCYAPREADDTCHCDVICEMYGDCCYDYWSTCKNETLEISREKSMPQDRLVCRTIGGIHCRSSIKMIAACPSSFDLALVSKRCKKFSLPYMAPVYGKQGYVYANKYCAQCHGEASRDLIKLQPSLECPDDPVISRILQNLTVADEYSWMTLQTKCVYNVSLPTSIERNIRHCSQMKNYDNRCHYLPEVFQSREQYEMLYRACNTYQGFFSIQYKYISHDTSYYWRDHKNSHCAMCTEVLGTAHNVGCPTPERRVKRQQCLAGPGAIVGPSFKILLDFDNDFKTDLVESVRSCPTGHTYDSVSDMCKPVKCPQGYRFLETMCLRDTGLRESMTTVISVDFKATFDIDYPALKKVIPGVFDNAESPEIFTYNQSSSGNVSRVTGHYRALRDKPISRSTTEGLLLCEMIANQSNALKLHEPKPVFIWCNISLQYKEDAENCFRESTTYDLRNNTTVDGIYNSSVIDKLDDEGSLVHVSVNLTGTFLGGSFKISGKLSTTHCTLPSMACPLAEVESSLVALRNSTHLLLRTGEFYEADRFKTTGNQTYICTEIVENFTEVSQAMFTLQISENIVHYYMTVVGLGLSIAGLTLTLVVYMALEKLRTVPGKILMNLTLSLLLAQFFFAFGTGQIAWPNFCIANAVLEHYLWLVSFFWMNVISLDLAKTFMSSSLLSHDERGHSLLAVYSVYSWGFPLLEVAACFLLDILDVVPDNDLKYASIRACFLSGYNGMLYAFVLPLTVIMVVNIICFIGVLVMLTKASSLEKKIQKNRIKRNQHFLLAKLLPITGLTWTFGVVATFSKISFLWNPFIILNSLQGVFVFCAFVLNKRVKGMLKAKFSHISQEATRTSNTRF